MGLQVETIGDATVYCGDMDVVLPSKEWCEHVDATLIDAIVTDPPYGIGEAAGKNKSRGKMAEAKDYGNLDWDNAPCSPAQIALMRECSTWQVIFGGNYFELPPAKCWLVWDKMNGTNDFADCELAWTNLDKAVRQIQWRWNGMIRQKVAGGFDDVRVHPTQKPVGVMEWCLDQLPDDARVICDPFMGSGTTGVAALRRGKRFIGIEREPSYFDAACERLTKANASPDMFAGLMDGGFSQKSMEI